MALCPSAAVSALTYTLLGPRIKSGYVYLEPGNRSIILGLFGS